MADYVYGSSPYNQKMRRLSSSGLQRRTRTYQSRPSYSRTLPDALSDTLPPAAHPWMPSRPWPAVRFHAAPHSHGRPAQTHCIPSCAAPWLPGCSPNKRLRRQTRRPQSAQPRASLASPGTGSPVPFPCRDHALPHPPHKAR